MSSEGRKRKDSWGRSGHRARDCCDAAKKAWGHLGATRTRKRQGRTLNGVCSMSNTSSLDFWLHNCRKSIAVGVNHLVCRDLLWQPFLILRILFKDESQQNRRISQEGARSRIQAKVIPILKSKGGK